MDFNNTIMPSHNELETIIDLCSQQDNVRSEVLKNHNDNLWWPLKVSDWRIRMLVAGLSTRVSYRMVGKYISVVDTLNKYSFDKIKTMDEREFRKIVKSIGLQDNRVVYWKSLIAFFNKLDDENINHDQLSNDEFIQLIQENVNGAGYKVAQCCVLYARGYYCGVMPVDSGMKDVLGPCLGFSYKKSGAISHEIFRKQLEGLIRKVNCKQIASKNNYKDLLVPDTQYLTWWTHLVLIYFKRLYCNRRDYMQCPLRNFNHNELNIGKMCFKENPESGGHRLLLIEGIDGVGKTTLSKMLLKFDYKLIHFDYNLKEMNLFNYYQEILKSSSLSKMIFDRSYVSERVYGMVLRGKSRISDNEFINLLNQTKEQRGVFLYLYLDKRQLLQRVNIKDKKIIEENYDDICNAYNKELEIVKKYIPVIKLNANNLNIDNLDSKLNFK
jgi:endonuclease III-like uncharacterized protein/thymidylate kinase